MIKEFVKYEQALALKELGFDEPCFVSVDSEGKNMRFHDDHTLGKNSEIIYGIYLPLHQQAFRWFREKGFVINIYSTNNDGEEWYFLIKKGTITTNDYVINTYEEAESACLDKLIEICKNK